MKYDGQNAKYLAPNLTDLAEHITLGGITSMARQSSPDSIVWFGLGTGDFRSMVYERDQNVVAWSKHPIAGNVMSVAVLPNESQGEDEVWIAIARTVNGTTSTRIERFAWRNYWITQNNIANCIFVDASITASTALSGGLYKISGLSHLIGQTVAVLADGVSIGTFTVSGSGTITVPNAITIAQVGLPYTYKLEPMRPDISTRAGTSHGSIVTVKEMAISFLNTLNALYCTVDTVFYPNTLYPQVLFMIDWTNPQWYNSCSIAGLFTGDVVVSTDSGFSLENPLIIEGSDVYPCTVRCLVPRQEVTGR
jgi:hypothetical protein